MPPSKRPISMRTQCSKSQLVTQSYRKTDQRKEVNERGKGGGLAFLIHDIIQFSKVNISLKDNHTEVQAIKLRRKNNITLVNVYIPPSSSCENNFNATLKNLIALDDSIIVGDINAHNPLWHSKLQCDARGNNIPAEIDNSNHVVLNEKAHTRITEQCKSSPDISLASSSVAMNLDWRTELALGSDHLPIILSVNCDTRLQETSKRTFNFRKSNWEGFREDTEKKLSRSE